MTSRFKLTPGQEAMALIGVHRKLSLQAIADLIGIKRYAVIKWVYDNNIPIGRCGNRVRSHLEKTIKQPFILQEYSTNKELIATCSHFGCAAHLTLREQLFGDKCIHHSKNINYDKGNINNR